MEDNSCLAQMQKQWLEREDYEAVTAMDEPSARKAVNKTDFDLILSDVRLPEGDGISFLKWMAKSNRETPFVIMTDYACIPDAVCAIKLGAKDYLSKPVHRERLLELADGLLRPPVTVRRKEKVLFRRDSAPAGHAEQLVKLVAPSDISVLILGGSGTGKESVARSIHARSLRNDGPFVAVNCSLIQKELAPSLFFGHVKGSFTGADSGKEGYFDMAEGGTLFLDEAGTLPVEVQGMLLRVLQEGAYYPLGGNRERKTDVRIVSATNEDLEEAMRNGRFRADLYHRLNEFDISLPPLAECRADILPLADFFRKLYSEELKRQTDGFTGKAEELLLAYPWPGNIRELENKVRRAVLVSGMTGHSTLDPADLGLDSTVLPSFPEKTEGETDEEERERIDKAMEESGNNVSRASKILGISRVTLYTKLGKLGLRKKYGR